MRIYTNNIQPILDLLFANRPENVIKIEPIGNLATSDHSILFIDVLFRSKFNKSCELIYDWKNGNHVGLSNWMEVLQVLNTDESWDYFVDKITTGTDTFIPT